MGNKSFLHILSKQKTKVLGLFFLNLFLFGLLYLGYGFYYEAGNGVYSNLFSGSYADEPFNNFYYQTMVFVSYALAFLYEEIPALPWYDLYGYSLLLISSTLVSYILFELLCKYKINLVAKLLVILFVFTIIVAPNIVFLNQTRISIFVPAVALIFWSFLNGRKQEGSFITSIHYYSCILLFLLGAMVRLEGGLLALAIVFVYEFLTSAKKTSSILQFSIPSLLMFAVILMFVFIAKNSNEFNWKIEPDIEYQISDRQNVVPINEMQNAKDSAKYIMATNWIVNDPNNISVEFLESIIAKSKVRPDAKGYMIFRLKHMIGRHYVIFLLFLLCILLCFYYFFNHEIKLLQLITIVLFNGFIISILIGIMVSVKMEDKIWIPVLSISILLNIIYVLNRTHLNTQPIKESSKWYLVLCFFIFSILGCRYLNSMIQPNKSALKKSLAFINTINEDVSEKYLMLDVSSIHYTYTAPFNNVHFSNRFILLLYNLGSLSLTPQYKTYLDGVCQCNSSDYGEMYEFLYSKKEDVAILGKKNSLKLTENYLADVYQMPYLFIEKKYDLNREFEINTFELQKK